MAAAARSSFDVGVIERTASLCLRSSGRDIILRRSAKGWIGSGFVFCGTVSEDHRLCRTGSESSFTVLCLGDVMFVACASWDTVLLRVGVIVVVAVLAADDSFPDQSRLRLVKLESTELLSAAERGRDAVVLYVNSDIRKVGSIGSEKEGILDSAAISGLVGR
jgi:translation elongation factor EF-Tu-like GTPase